MPVPAGWRLRPARGLRRRRGGKVLLGGSPTRLITLSPRGAALVDAWLAGQPVTEGRVERVLARRLLDAGFAHPEPPPRPRATEPCTIVIPVHGRPDQLARCLAGLTGEVPVIVVDDGSPDGRTITAVADRHGARYVRHPENRGASAARNTGLGLATTPLVAFLDADCIPPAGFPGALLDHLADPAVALVAPRIVSSGGRAGRIAAYERCHSALDMGPNPSLVRPYSWVWYVPSAAMVARRDALGAGFDEDLSLGEDVDLVWRLHDAGWHVRYEPRSCVAHEDRIAPIAWYRRRVAYNESVAPLLRRHPDRLPALFVSPPAALGWGAWLSGWWPVLAALTAVRARRLQRSVSERLPGAAPWAARSAVEVTIREGRELWRALVGPWSPFALAALAACRDRGLTRRLAALLAAGIVADWVEDRPALDPVSYGALRLADESARGLGIWAACLRARDFRALAPRRPPPPEQR
ncbi:MAG TPA: mycofactocin biosynthesis glycosyltransferase MftF [Solirubrobacteraceae bacterium]|nr:mycofactocin biosynthesis glycosyltransferase MftF [Solirubrobacteraceae bacterium]